MSVSIRRRTAAMASSEAMLWRTSAIEGGDFAHFRLAEAAGGDGGTAEADAAGIERRIHVEGNSVLVDCDAGAVEGGFGLFAANAFGENIDQHEVGIGAAGHDMESGVHKGGGERLRVGDDLLLILHVAGLHGFLESYGLGRHDVHQRATLDAGEDGLIDGGGEFLFAQDEAARAGRARFYGWWW